MTSKPPFGGALGPSLADDGTSVRSAHTGLNGAGGQASLGPASKAATATVAALDLQTEFELETELDLEDEMDLESGPELADTADPRSDAQAWSSYLDMKPPHLARPGRARIPGLLRSRIRARAGYATRGRKWRRRMAVPMLVLLVVAGLALTGVIVGLLNGGNGWASGQAAAQSPLVMPAPELAAGLPKHDPPLHNAIVQQLITDFISRFTSAVGSYTDQPNGLYREPGTIDLATDQPGWVMYLGDNATAELGAPAVTIRRVMAALTETSAPGAFWSVAPGPRGGSAGCAIALYGSTAVSVCAWATETTIGALMSPLADTRGNELAALMPLMRLDLQPGWPSRRLRTSVG